MDEAGRQQIDDALRVWRQGDCVLGELHRLRPDPLYLEHSSRITDAIVARQRRRDPPYPDKFAHATQRSDHGLGP